MPDTFTPSGISSVLIRGLVHSAVRLYYPRTTFEGREHLKGEGPFLFVANHPNSIIDPVMVGMAAGRPVHFLAKAPLFDIPIFGRALSALGMIPAFRAQDGSRVRDNLQSLETAAEVLAEGRCLGVFPEGQSLDTLQLGKIKSGTARIAVSAFAKGAKGLKIVPIGINLEDKETFLSRAWVRIGKPIALAGFEEQISENEKAAARAITERIEDGLKEVSTHLDKTEWEPFLNQLECLVPPPRSGLTVGILPLRQRKRIADAMNHYAKTDPEMTKGVVDDLGRLDDSMAEAGFDGRSPFLREYPLIALPSLLFRSVQIALGSLSAAIGSVFYLIPFLIGRTLAARWKEPGRTTTALYRLLAGLLVYTSWHVAVWFIVSGKVLPWISWLTVWLMPLLGVHALNWWPSLKRLGGRWKEAWTTIANPGKVGQLKEKHSGMTQRLAGLLKDYERSKEIPPLVEHPISERALWIRRGMAWTAVILMLGLTWWSIQSRKTSRLPELAVVSPDFLSREKGQTKIWIERDEATLNAVLQGLGNLETQAMEIRGDFMADRRSYFRQEDNDAIRSLLLSYLNYRTALTRILWRYQKADEIPEEDLRERCQALLLASASALYDASLKLVVLFGESQESIRKLNEPEPVWQIPGDIYDTTREQLNNEFYSKWLLGKLEEWKKEERGPDSTPFNESISRFDQSIRSLLPRLSNAPLGSLVSGSQAVKDSVVYEVQSFVSYWIGKARIRESKGGETLISDQQVENLRNQLQPGDIIIERRNWVLSNAFLPGYWPHAALYIGSRGQLQELGLHEDGRVAPHWKSLESDHHPTVVIEALAPGVILTSLEHSVGEADSVCVLRPRLSTEQKKEAIARAFSHLGKPYDFDFDFFSSDKLVCTELVFRAYDGSLEFPLVDVMGRKTLPAMEILKDHFKRSDTGTSTYEFISYLDGDDEKGEAEFRDQDALRESLSRSSLTFMQ